MVDPRQILIRNALQQLTSGVTGVELDDVLKSIDLEAQPSLRMRKTSDYVITVDSIAVNNPIVDNDGNPASSGAGNDRSKIIPPIDGVLPFSFTSATVTVPSTNNNNITQSTSGDTLLLNITTDGHYQRIGINIDGSGLFALTAGSQSATATSASAPAIPSGYFGIGHILVQRNGTAIEPISGIFQYSGGGGGGGSSSSSGSGIKNYIANPDAQIDSANSTDTANVTMTRTTTTANLPEEGYKQYAWSVSASGAATDGTDYAQWDTAFAWDDADTNTAELKAKVKATGGWKFVAWNTTDDEAASAESDEIIQDQTVRLTIYPQPTKTFVVRAIPTTANPPDIYATDVTLSPEAAGSSGYIGRWQSYTPSPEQGFTGLTSRLQWRINGQNIEIKGDFDVATVGGNVAHLGLPNGYTIGWEDTTVDTRIVGCFERDFASTNVIVFPALASHGDTFLEIGYRQQGILRNGLIAQVGDIIGVNGDRWTVDVSVPVVELKDNYTLTATEAQLQNSKARFYRSAAGGYSLNTTFVFDTTDTTTYEAPIGINNSSGIMSVDQAGTYDIICALSANPAWAANSQMTLHVNRNGGGYVQERIITRPGAAAFTLSGPASVYLTPNDLFQIQVNASATINQGSSLCYIEIRKRSARGAQIPGFPFTDVANDTDQVLVPRYREGGEGDIGTITNWASPGSKKYRWTRIGNIVHFWWYVTATSGSASSSATTLQYDLPGDVPSPANHISNDASGEFPIPCSGAANTNNFVKNYIDNNAGTYRPSGAFDTNTAATYWSGYATWMINP